MGMEPFVAADDNAFGHLIGSIPNPIANLQQAIAFKVGIGAQQARNQALQAQAAETAQKLSRAEMFQRDVAAVGADPSARAISSLITRYPEFADQLKQGWDVKDKAAQQSDLTQLGETYSAAASGNWELAHRQAQARVDADKAAGRSDPNDDAFLQQIDAAAGGDEKAKKAVLTTLGTHIAAVSGPEHFASVYGALKGGYTLEPGAVRLDDNGQVIGHSPLIKGDDGALYDWNSVMGGAPAAESTPRMPAFAPPADAPPEIAAVASTLSSAGLPAPVVAGFLGNFDAEGGYGGAKGDGGTAHGIAQLRGDRAANFEKVIGKPVAEASPAEQAQFTLWEMQHPEAAGMTVQQRDAILAAKTAPQAAALIDQYYERSSGEHRSRRMAAAERYYSGSNPAAAGSGGPKPLLAGKQKEQIRLLTDEEAAAKGLPTNQTYKMNTATGDISPVTGTAEAEDALDPETKTFYAQQVLSGAPMPALGMGKAAAKARQDIMKEVARMAGAEGMSGADLATQISHYKAATQAIKTLETQAGTIESNEQTALANGQQFIDRSKEVSGQTRFPAVNSVTQTYLRATGDPTIVAMDAAWNTFVTEYAKVVAGSPSGAGTLSDSARHEAQEVMRGNYSYPQKLAAFKQMQADMANRMAAIHGTIASKYDQLTKNPKKAAEIASQTDLRRARAPDNGAGGIVRVRSVQQYNSLKPGTKYLDPNGVQRVKR